MSDSIILEVQNITHNFGKFRALSDVSLKIPTGRLCALIGPNGAGKTTFYNVVSGRYRPSFGKIFFEGRDVSRLPPHRRVALGMLRSFQITNVFPALTVIENVIAPLVIHHGLSFSFWSSLKKRRALTTEAEQILDRVGLTGHSGSLVSTLAYGDKRLIEIAIVLARNPKLVMLDEPTAGMNPEETDRMISLIKELSKQSDTTFFITEHDMKVVFSVSETIFVLNQGSLLIEGAPDKIKSDPRVRQVYLGGDFHAAGD